MSDEHPVIHSARWAAAQRAQETARADRLFADPLAAHLAGPEGLQALQRWEAENPWATSTSALVAIRTRFLDDLAARSGEEGIRQVVMLGAGMDARAFRLSWPEGTTMFELDHAEQLDTKDDLLRSAGVQPACRRVAVRVDLEDDWCSALDASGFRRDHRTLWLAEGLFYYLEDERVHQLLERASHMSARDSVLGADLASRSFFESPWTRKTLQALADCGMFWRFGTDDPESLFAAHGWSAHVSQPGEAGATYGRWAHPVFPREQREVPRSFLVVARRL